MQNGLISLAVGLGFACLATLTAQADFEVEVAGIQSDHGVIRALVFTSAKGFPEERGQAVRELSVPARLAKEGRLVLKFKDLKANEGVVSVFHDLDESGTMKKNILGMPREPVAISGWSGKRSPKFQQCSGQLVGLIRVVLREF